MALPNRNSVGMMFRALLFMFFITMIPLCQAQAQFNTGREIKYYWGTLTTQYGYWIVDTETIWNFSREGLSPAALNNYQGNGGLNEISLTYETYDSLATIEFNYIAGTLRGRRNTYEYCEGAYVTVVEDCGEVPAVQHHRENVFLDDVSIFILDIYQDIVTLENKRGRNIYAPAIYDYDWLVGYMLWYEDYTFLGNQYNQGGGTDVPYTQITSTNDMLWSAGRLGVAANYYPLGYEGGWQIKGQAAYLLITAYGLSNDQINYSGLRADTYYSGSGSGLLLDLDVIYNFNKKTQMGFSIREWELEAKGRQRSEAFPDAAELSSLKTSFDGTMVFINIAF